MALTPHGRVFFVSFLTLASGACLPATQRGIFAIGVVVFVCFLPGDLHTGVFIFFWTVKNMFFLALRGLLSMSNGSGSAMMLEIRCQLVYLMPGATD